MPSTGVPDAKSPGSQCGAPASATLLGPPERITPLDLSQGGVERQDLGINRQLPQTPRNELGELGAEIENDDGLMGHGENAIIGCVSALHHHIL
jgi:hypothetical protein